MNIILNYGNCILNIADVINQIGIDIITKVIMFTAIIMLFFVIVLFLARKKKNGARKKVLAWILIVILALNVAATFGVNKYNILINQFLSGSTVTEEEASDVTDGSEEMTRMLSDEGIVLLKNNLTALPVKKGNLNVFGYASRSTVFGGSGSGAGDENDNVTLNEGLENAGYCLNENLIKFYRFNFLHLV
jgi:beta-glucosidase